MVEKKEKKYKTYPTVKPTHIPITYTASINDVFLDHLVTVGFGFGLVDGVGLVPMFFGNNSELDGGGCEHRYPALWGRGWMNNPSIHFEHTKHIPLELSREGLLVQKHIWITVSPIKPVLDLPNTLHSPIQIRIASQNHKRRVGMLVRCKSRIP